MRTRLLTAAAVIALAPLSLSACGDGSGPDAASSPAAGHLIPDDFPLLDGYPPATDAEGPDDGPRGPSRDLRPVRFEACGTRLPLPEVTDQLRAGWTNPEDVRERQLSAFDTTAQAEHFVAAIEELYADCAREDTEDGYTSVNDLVDGSLGDDAVTHVRHYELDGAPAIGLSTTTVVRVGSWVLVSSTYGEGSADTRQEVEDAASRGEAAVEDLVAEMQPSA